MLAQFGHVEIIKPIEAHYDNSLCGVLFKNGYEEFDHGIIRKIFLQSLAKREVML